MSTSATPVSNKQAILHIYTQSFDRLMKTINPNEISMDNIVLLIIKTMEIVDEQTTLKGEDKKNMVLGIVGLVIKKYVTFQNIKESMLEFIDIFGGSIVENVISVSNKTFNINQRRHMYRAMKITYHVYHSMKSCFCKAKKKKGTLKPALVTDHTEVVSVLDQMVADSNPVTPSTTIDDVDVDVNVDKK